MKQYRAAITALNNSLKDFANSKYREEMMFLKLNSHFLYAENSLPAKQRERYQEALDDYFSFVEEFPKSEYQKDVASIYDKTNRYLKAHSPAGAQEEQVGENKQ
jgi:outer membrane protein assembly factor BamD